MTGPIDPNTINRDSTQNGKLGASAPSIDRANNTINDNLTYHSRADLILLGRYKLLRELGRGGMGVVWLAQDTALTEDPKRPELRAIKILPEELATDPRAIAGLKHEARLTARLNHPGIVRLYNFEEDPAARVSFLLMEYIAGLEDKHGRPVTYTLRGEVRPVINLSHLLAVHERLPEKAVRNIGAAILEALGYAHSFRELDIPHGIIHRDIKPANVLLTPDARPRLSDFGIARTLQTSLTHLTGRVSSGTLTHMAPELFEGKPGDHRADIYAFGIMLYELLTGTPPFVFGDIARLHLTVSVPRIEGVSPEMNDIIQWATAKKPEDRPPDAAALREALQTAPAPPKKPLIKPDPKIKTFIRFDKKKAIWSGIMMLVVMVAAACWLAIDPFSTQSPYVAPYVPQTSPATPIPTETPTTNATPEPSETPSLVDSIYATETPNTPQGNQRSPDTEDLGENAGPLFGGGRANASTAAPVSTSAELESWTAKLTKNQRIFMQWTDRNFYRIINHHNFSEVSDTKRLAELQKSLKSLNGPRSNTRFYAISTLGAIGDKQAVKPLLAIACDRTEPDCRDNWMAVRALGQIGDKTVVPDLIHLTYHTNVNVHLWAQISLVQLTGQNFGYNWKTWGEWWNDQGGQPPCKFEKIRWRNDPQFDRLSTAGELIKADEDFILKITSNSKQTPAAVEGKPTPAPTQMPLSSKAAYVEGQNYTEDLGNGVTLEMVWIPGGTFMMGSPESEAGHDKNEGPQHQVILDGFWMGKFEVTQAQWWIMMGTSIAQQRDKANRYWGLMGEGDRFPMYYVNWDEAAEFCRKLSQLTGRKYSLPSEAQWEYACRAGTTTPFSSGTTISTEQANYNGSTVYGSSRSRINRKESVEVGSFKANGFGLYDMQGNVSEWCRDGFHDNYSGAPTDGTSWESSATSNHVRRNGSWASPINYCRSAYRGSNPSAFRGTTLGFRVIASR